MYKMVLRHDVGSQAVDFTLKNAEGKPFSLADGRGKTNLVLIFFMGGFDADAVRSLRELADSYPRIQEYDGTVIAITPEVPSKVRTLVEGMRLPFEVLSDLDMEVTKAYDVYNPATNWAWPAAFIIDRSGVIQYVFRGASPPNTPPTEYIVRKLEQMKAGNK